MSSFRWLLPLLIVVPVASISAQTYELDDETLATTGCTGPSPCLCPVFSLGEISGTFDLEFVETQGSVDVYAVSNVDWIIAPGSPGEQAAVGDGEFRLDTENETQELSLDLLIDGTVRPYFSGIVPGGGAFPAAFSIEVFHEVDPPCLYDGLFVSAAPSPVPMEDFKRGDANGDGSVAGLTDGLFLLSFQFIPGSDAPPCFDAADFDDDGTVNGLIDGLGVLNFQFVPGSPPPPAPGPNDCGADPTPDALDCEIIACP